MREEKENIIGREGLAKCEEGKKGEGLWGIYSF